MSLPLPPNGSQWCSECAAGILAGQDRKLTIGLTTYSGASFCEEHYRMIRRLDLLETATPDENGVLHYRSSKSDS